MFMSFNDNHVTTFRNAIIENDISLAFIWQSIQNDTLVSSWTITESRSLLNDSCTCYDMG